ncbi:hypothetical protein [Tepidimicrobium xylanilyticum]|uniref:Uncharacterized protein n=1 Tax=Tepidimicrobium xylanilyticum TaxID=1123352 RepID=A0A1H3B6T9_9FIRM|nr:hypothetical protein [Tepidimicrobium xylanilyticum]GMG96982.1 hypothetical protein EN5CB1_18080 [Tepidimicrobium xylanilyticum]SDX37623.1 hypothetical protein SAMN05660923_02190 [Tepidimicrobium xylanilyticum]
MAIKIIAVAVLATSLTYFIIFKLNKGPVLASAIVTLASGIILPHFFPEEGVLLATVATTGSYAAMVSRERFPKLTDMIFVGIISGIVFILAEEAFVGVGGRLGSIAAISCFTWLGIKKAKERIL